MPNQTITIANLTWSALSNRLFDRIVGLINIDEPPEIVEVSGWAKDHCGQYREFQASFNLKDRRLTVFDLPTAPFGLGDEQFYRDQACLVGEKLLKEYCAALFQDQLLQTHGTA